MYHPVHPYAKPNNNYMEDYDTSKCMDGRYDKSCLRNGQKTSIHSKNNSYETMMKTVTKDTHWKLMLSVSKCYTSDTMI